MIDKEKLIKIKSLADAMYYAAFNLTTDASLLRKAMKEYHQFIIHKYHKEEPVSEELEDAANKYAIESYPDEPSTGQFGTGEYESYVNMSGQRECAVEDFKAGAEWQAEKDLELTWEDIEEIYFLVIETDNAYMEANAQNDYQYDVKEMYQEVLKRFRERKEK